jgi:hypothetical protein
LVSLKCRYTPRSLQHGAIIQKTKIWILTKAKGLNITKSNVTAVAFRETTEHIFAAPEWDEENKNNECNYAVSLINRYSKLPQLAMSYLGFHP